MQANRETDRLWRELETNGPAAALRVLPEYAEGEPLVRRTLRGLVLLENENHAAAAAEFRAVLQQEPQNPVARHYLILALFGLGEDAEAGELLLATGAVLFPQRAFLIHFVRVFWPLRFTTSLGRTIVPAAATPPEDPFAAEYAAWLEQRDGLDRQRLELLDRADSVSEVIVALREWWSARTTPEGRRHHAARRLAARYHARGMAAYHSEDKQLANFLFSRAHEIRPLCEEFADHYASLTLLAGDAQAGRETLAPFLVRAVERFDKSREQSHLPPIDTVIMHAWTLHEVGEHAEALRALSTIRPDGPFDLGAHYLAAVCWLMLGNDRNYQKAMEEALGPYFIDSWEQLVHPFVQRVGEWLKRGGRSVAAGDGA
jgi:tetratricopeptide (TPR) repeat protein